MENGQLALESARTARPDLILTDIMMPKLDGFGLLRAVRNDPELAGTPVIMLSARAGEAAKIEGLDAGADDYLIKPFAARELLARINTNIQMAVVRREAARAVMQSEQRFLMTQERLSLALSAMNRDDVSLDRTSQQSAGWQMTITPNPCVVLAAFFTRRKRRLHAGARGAVARRCGPW